MKVKQKSIRAFEFTINDPSDEDEFLSYIDQNIEILKNFLISINGNVSQKTKIALEQKDLNTLYAGNSLHKKDTSQDKESLPKKESNDQIQVIDEKKDNNQQCGLINYNIPIRSGSELECDDDIIILKRINSGAKVIARKNAIIFGMIDGNVEANGDFIILKSIGKGHVVFNGEEIKKESLGKNLCRVVIKDSILVYEEL